MTQQLVPPVFSVVVPCFNEGVGLQSFHKRLCIVMESLDVHWEVIFVDDGSTDETVRVLQSLHESDPRVFFLKLSRNFGKEIALTAGLDHARASAAVIVIDADLQDPPEVIATLIATYHEGFDMVYAQRRARHGDPFFKRVTAYVFYRLMTRLGGRVVVPPDTGDFRLMSRRAVNALLLLRERHRFMKGLFAWIGFPAKSILYDRDPRLAGRSSFNYWALWNLAIEGITSFSVTPLRIATYFGFFVALIAVLYGSWLMGLTLLRGNPVPGYPSLMVVILFLGGVQLICLGMLGEYVGRIFNETKQRPLYLVEELVMDGSTASSRAEDTGKDR